LLFVANGWPHPDGDLPMRNGEELTRASSKRPVLGPDE
jgi:hypothetical protein